MSFPDLNLLIALHALLEEGSVVGAAQKMNLSPTAMSRTLTRLRNTLDDPLFVRAGRKLVPTPKALAMQAQVAEAVRVSTQLLTANDDDITLIPKQFNVRANDIFIGLYSGKLIEALSIEMPKAKICFTPEQNDIDSEALRNGVVDLFISSARHLGPEIRVQSLFTTNFVGVARQGHDILKKPVSLQDFIHYNHLSVSRRGKFSGPIDNLLEDQGLSRNVISVAPTPYSALFMLEQSDLLLTLPEQLAQTAVQAGLKIATFDLPFALENVQITQSWHPRFQNDLAHQWLRRKIYHLSNPTLSE